MSDPIKEETKVKPIKKDLQAQLVEAVKKGNFKKARRLRLSLSNLK
jgi:hypothetical protein